MKTNMLLSLTPCPSQISSASKGSRSSPTPPLGGTWWYFPGSQGLAFPPLWCTVRNGLGATTRATSLYQWVESGSWTPHPPALRVWGQWSVLVCLPVTGEARCPVLRVGADTSICLQAQFTFAHLPPNVPPSVDSELKRGKNKSRWHHKITWLLEIAF